MPIKKPDPEQDDIRPEYDFSSLKGGVRGKYYERVVAGSHLVLLDPDVAKAFPSQEAVNRALRMLAEIAHSATEG
jgi:hypothetical protein